MTPMKILITGAAGTVGRALRRELAAAGHRLRLADVRPLTDAEGESLQLDVADGPAVYRAVEGMDAVVHLAYGLHSYDHTLADIRASFDVNVKGTFLLLWAAQQQGVRRFVYTSTLSVFGDGRLYRNFHCNEETPPQPSSLYGLTKWMGEEACQMFARRHGLSVAVLRLCLVQTAEEWEQLVHSRCHARLPTHVEDVARAIHLALTVPGLRGEVLHIAADNPGQVTDIERAKQVLGFWPRHRLEQ